MLYSGKTFCRQQTVKKAAFVLRNLSFDHVATKKKTNKKRTVNMVVEKKGEKNHV